MCSGEFYRVIRNPYGIGIFEHESNTIAKFRTPGKFHFANASDAANGGVVSVLPRSKIFSTTAPK